MSQLLAQPGDGPHRAPTLILVLLDRFYLAEWVLYALSLSLSVSSISNSPAFILHQAPFLPILSHTHSGITPRKASCHQRGWLPSV